LDPNSTFNTITFTHHTLVTRRPRKAHCFSPRLAGVAAAFLLAALHAPLPALAQEEPPPWLLCGSDNSGTYTESSTYEPNINRLATTLPRNASSSPVLYASDSAGSVPDRVRALAACRGDSTAATCESCVAAAFLGAQRRCPLAKDVLIFDGLCQLRYSNRMFFRDRDNFVTTRRVVGSPIGNPTKMAAFDAAVRLLVNATADYAAAGNSSRRFATEEMGFDGDESRRHPRIYALSQCTPDGRVDNCRSCLSLIVGELPRYFSGRNGGGIFGTWRIFPVWGVSFLLRPTAAAAPHVRGGVAGARTCATGDYKSR
jgi:hypothetical protein